jgi:GT2 family glycosyltransferase
MISVLLSVRNNREQAAICLGSLIRAFGLLKLPAVEYLLIDDHSDPKQEVPQLFEQFRREAGMGGAPPAKITTFVFKQQQHYTRALAYGFSAARGRQVLFVSHDMFVTGEYVRTLMAVATTDDTIGLVRGTSSFVDCFPEHTIPPPVPVRSYDDLEPFARYVSGYYGLTWTEDPLLTGDSMLIKREVFDKIGVFDSRYFGYFGDIDFGLRLQRAGFKMVCAKGAWLWHEGQGAYKDQANRTGTDYQVIHRKRMEVVNEAYKLFRAKWDPSLPPRYPGALKIDYAALRARPPLAESEHQPFVRPTADICEIRES